MHREDDTIEIFLVALVVFIAVVAAVVGFKIGQQDVHREAIRVGVAHYEASAAGTPEFVWNKPVKP
jgi:hypothetical protein